VVARILIVDDEPDLRGLVRLVLEIAGHTVVEANHGRTALDRMRETDFHLMVTDVMMPVMNGSDLIDAVRATPAGRLLPILVLSASPHGVAEADLVMQKPFRPDDLRVNVASLLTKVKDD
jgi:two-component system, chemotaxis family, chemotaxis protein CheY